MTQSLKFKKSIDEKGSKKFTTYVMKCNALRKSNALPAQDKQLYCPQLQGRNTRRANFREGMNFADCLPAI